MMNAIAFAEPIKIHYESINAERLAQVKAAYTTRRIPATVISGCLVDQSLQPQPGDLLLAQVGRIGQHTRLELQNGRKAPLFAGDEVLLCYGHRYSPDQFEAYVPENLDTCHLVAAGGVAAKALTRHKSKRTPTEIQPVGLIADAQGQRINLADWGLSLQSDTEAKTKPAILVSVGTAMNSGKTTTAAHLIRGLKRAGYKVGAAKITGTGAGGDVWLMQDAGAHPVIDFTDAGYVSTYQLESESVEEIFSILTAHLKVANVDAIILEIADGLLQHETAQLLSSALFQNQVNGLLFSASDAMGASAGVTWLRQRNLPVLGLSGTLTASPLAQREAEQATRCIAYTSNQLADPVIATALMRYATSIASFGN